MNRRTSRRLPDGRTQSYNTYDGTGNLTNYTDLAGNAFINAYSPLDDKLTGVTGPGVSEAYTYDSFLRRHSFTDGTGTTTFNYDERDRMVGQSGPAGTLTFGYLPSGQVNTVESSNTNGNNLTYEYDSLNRPATILDGNKTTTINYDQVSNLAVINMPNGVAVTQTYDSLNRMTGINVAGTGGTLGSYQYTLGASGNRVNVQEYNGRAVSIVNDDLYRLTNEIITGDPASNNGNIGYGYDNVGNRDTRTSFVTPIPTQTFTGGYNPADELKPTFNFDNNGNQLSDAQSRTYTYNNFSQLTRVQGTSVDVAYVYDGDGLRVKKTNNLTGVTTNYLWDRNNLTGYPQVSEELVNGQVTRRYVYGPAGPLYMSQLVGGNWVTSYFGKDAQNVRFLMNDSGQISDAYTWDAFGNLLSSTGAGTVNNTGAFGEYADTDTGLVYLRARWMNPTLGRFMQMDTDEGDPEDPLTLSKYEYTSNNPENMIDPSGHDSVIDEVLSVVDVLWPSSNKVFGAHHFSTKLYAFMERPQIEGFVPYIYDDLDSSNPRKRWTQGDPVKGRLTVGVGHKCSDVDIQKYDKPGISLPQANDLLGNDLEYSSDAVQNQITVILLQNQFDALTSFTFNVGPDNLGISALKTDLNHGDYKDVPDLMMHFLRAGNSYPPGLKTRRQLEGALFANGTY